MNNDFNTDIEESSPPFPSPHSRAHFNVMSGTINIEGNRTLPALTSRHQIVLQLPHPAFLIQNIVIAEKYR